MEGMPSIQMTAHEMEGSAANKNLQCMSWFSKHSRRLNAMEVSLILVPPATAGIET
jgi:hypothetical protein